MTPRHAASCVLRPARAGDLDAIVALEAACFPAADRFPRRSWRRLLAVPTAQTTLAVDADGLAGAIVALLRGGSAVARIYSIAVAPDRQGRGLGRALVAAAARRLPRRVRSLSLEVRASNRAARALYERLGFVQTRELPGYYADGADGLRLVGRLPLPGPAA